MNLVLVWMIYSPNELIDSLTNWIKCSRKQLFTELDWTIPSEFIKIEWFTYKLDWMTSKKEKKNGLNDLFIKRNDLFLTNRIESDQKILNKSEWFIHRTDMLIHSHIELNDLQKW